MKYVIPFSVFLSVLLFSCKRNDTVALNNSCALAGRFFNRTVLDQCPIKMPVDIPYYALELTFDSTEFVDIRNGIEKFRLPYAKAEKKCQYKIRNAVPSGDILFEVIGDSLIQMYDSAWTKADSFSVFKKDKLPSRSNWSFENNINLCAIAGNYMIAGKDGKRNPVYFLPNGQVSGIRPYLSYSLCYAGDCLEETLTPSNIIEFTDDRGSTELYAYERSKDQSIVQFFTIGDPIPGIKGERTIGGLAFEIETGLTGE